MASSRGSDDKSWSELASEAAGVAKSALGKLGQTISDTVTALVPQRKQAPPQRSSQRQRYGRSDNEYGRLYPWERDQGSSGLTEGLMGGLVGRAMGGMLGGVARQLQQQQQQAADLRQQALHAVQGDRRVQAQLGRDISVGPGGSSQSTSSSWVNGQSTTTTTLQFNVVGSSGRQALTSVRESSSGSRGSRVSVQVQLPTGDVIDIDGSGGGGGSSISSEDIIDVEVRNVR
ncbi:g2969 [Coccomyxa viridis]|uniref:G2969 protein n=1 Tax=Coccomyxa viridis TaxID=1274662 RepID=A0ABP1FLN7_9CHLO